MHNFFQELKRRNVIRTGVAYLVAAWLVVEVTSVVAPAYHAPEWVLQVIIALLLIGLPVALLFSWAYEMTPEGLKPEREIAAGESEPQKTARRLDAITIGLLIITIGFVATDRLWLGERKSDMAPGGPTGTTTAQQAEAPSPEVAPQTEHSIAVLPFENMSEDPEQAYLADGVHEALLTDLAKIGELRVISRTSVLQFRETQQSLPEIARQLGVGWIIEGSVLRVGDQVRITAQLIDAANDEHRWAEIYDRDLRDILALMSTVASKIANQVHVALSPQEAARLSSGPIVDPGAQEAYLKARYYLNNLRGDGLQKAIKYFQQAIEIEPTFARAHASLAGAYFVSGLSGRISPAEAAELIRPEAARALELDEDLGLAHAVLGYISLYIDWDWDAAERYARRALELEPNDWFSIHLFADWLIVAGRTHESVDWMRLGQLIDPLSPLATNSLAGHLFVDGQYDAVVDMFNNSEGRTRADSAGFLRRALWEAGKFDQAAELYLEMWKANGAEELAAAFREGWESSGPEKAMAEVARAMEAETESEKWDAFTLAVYNARGGNNEAAAKWLQQAFEERIWSLIRIEVIPEFRRLHPQPDFQALVHKMGLPVDEGIR